MNRSDIMAAITAGKLKGVYLFEGIEENMKQTALAAVEKALLPEGLEELNRTLMDKPDTDSVIAAAETMPFMADKRLLILRDQPGLASTGADCDDRLIEYLPHLPDTAVLIFLHRGKAAGNRKLYKAVAKCGQVVTFDKLTEGELNRWIVQQFQAQNKLCAPATASLLAFTSGSDTALLETEIHKIAAYTGDRGGVTDDDVRAMATRSMECTVFQMLDAVVAGQKGHAFRLMTDLLRNGEERIGILAMLLRQYRMLQHLKIMQYEKIPPQEIPGRLGVSSYAVNNYVRQAKSLSGGKVKRAVQLLLDTEYRIKSGQLNQQGALEAALLEIFAL